MAPTMAVRTAPATPPPAIWPMMLPIFRRRGAIGEQRNQHAEDLPPAPPPIAPAMVFPSGAEIDVLRRARGDIFRRRRR